MIYLNNFIDNAYNAYSYASKNIWNSTEKITYTYKGSEFTNYMGNYWSDYTGSDADEDGIGDTAYSIYGDKDYHPLMKPFDNYFAPELAPKFLTLPFREQDIVVGWIFNPEEGHYGIEFINSKDITCVFG